MTNSSTASARLCAACGMCCDGVLFHAVELQKGDSSRQLASLGLKLRRKKGTEYFLQPCAAHREEAGACSCNIYEHRPIRCRLFDCRQLRGVASGEITEAEAQEKIREARARVAEVTALMDQIAETNPNRGLAHRVANALTLPKASAGISSVLHDQLDSTMQALEAFLQREFRV